MAAQELQKDAAVPIGAWLPAVALAWLVPGGGHMLLKRQGRAVLIMASVTLMFLFGLFMRGSMFTPQSGDLLTILINYGGFLGNMEPRMKSPNRNITVTETISSAARPCRLRRKCPPPGTNQASATAGSHCLIGTGVSLGLFVQQP